MEKILETKNLTKRFNQQIAINNVSMTIHKGDIYGLIGKNGAGKTTLLKLITQLIQPSNGQICLFGSSNQSALTKALKRSGSVIEYPVAYEQLSAYDNLKYYCTLRGIINPDQVIKETLEFVNLQDTKDKKFKNFSLGMKQKLGIAIAILSRPDFLILDEPINGLDPLAIVEFRQLIHRLNKEKGMTIIISSHILSELYQVATRFGFIENGQLIKEISKEAFNIASEDYIVLETSDIDKASQLIQELWQLKIKVVDNQTIHIFGQSHHVNEMIHQLIQHQIMINGIYYSKQNLENYFTQLLTNQKGEL